MMCNRTGRTCAAKRRSIFLFICFASSLLLTSVSEILLGEDETEQGRRRLEEVDFASSYWRPVSKTSDKSSRLQGVIQHMKSKPPPTEFAPFPWSPYHNASSHAIFSSAIDSTYSYREAINFVGTARKAGFDGDIVVATLPNADKALLDKLKFYKAIVYSVPIACYGKVNKQFCSFTGSAKKFISEPVPYTFIKYFFFQWWALKYEENSLIVECDFRDVFFQANPFVSKKSGSLDWTSSYQLQVFLEHHPNRVISRSVFDKGWVYNCYGMDALKMIGSQTISTAGAVMGTSRAIAAYSFLMTQQVDPKVRLGPNSAATNKACLSSGMDQGFHNWILYSGLINKYLNVRIVQQGEGTVNSVGGFHGDKKILRAGLADWKVLRGEAPYKYVYNWNGEISPVVHQMDRFLATEMIGGYRAHMAAFHTIV